jgi:hypothetical protein
MSGTARRTVSVLAACLAFAVGGCSLSESSKSSSKIVSSPFTSSSRSSDSEAGYREDVRDFTAAYFKSNGRPEDLRRKIADLAEKHGVSDWQDSESTYRGVGEGLGKAGARQVEVDAFKASLAENKQQAGWIQEGYESAK